LAIGPGFAWPFVRFVGRVRKPAIDPNEEKGQMHTSPRPGGVSPSPRHERGEITLAELLVAAPIALILLTATLMLHLASGREEERTGNRVESLIEQRQGLERMTRELREASSITPTSSGVVDAVAWLRPPGGGESVERQLRYDCSRGACERREGPAGGDLGGPVMVVPDVLNADVFDFQPDLVNPTYVTITLEIAVKGSSNPISLHDGVALRNLVRES
jgi:hypothetical protein